MRSRRDDLVRIAQRVAGGRVLIRPRGDVAREHSLISSRWLACIWQDAADALLLALAAL